MQEKILELDKEAKVYAGAILSFEDKIYITDNSSNMFFSVNVSTGEAEYKGWLYSDDDERNEMCHFMIAYYESIVFIPFNGSHINIFNVKENKMQNVMLPDTKRKMGRFLSGIIAGDELFLFGYFSDEILVYNLEKNEFCFVEYTKDEKMKNSNCLYDGLFIRDSVILGDTIYASMLHNSGLLEINSKTKSVIYRPIKNHEDGYSSIRFHNGSLWLISYFGNVLTRYELNSSKVEHIKLPGSDDKWSYAGIALLENNIFLIPCYGKHASLVNTISNSIVSLDAINNYLRESKIGSECIQPIIFQKKVYTFELQNGQMLVYDIETHKLKTFDVLTKKIVSQLVMNVSVIEGLYGLKEFVDEISENCNADSITGKIRKESIGADILRKLHSC